MTMDSFDKILTLDDYSRITGADYSNLKFPFQNFRYREMGRGERDETILTVLNKLDEEGLPVSGENDVSRWEKGWKEVLDTVQEKGPKMEFLRPQYFHYNKLRFMGDYVAVPDGSIEFEFYTAIRLALFEKYLKGAGRVIELGCGTGTNLIILQKLFPDIEIVGCDWARPSQEILKLMAKDLNANIHGIQFNMLTMESEEKINIDGNTAVITMHAMEQLGHSYSKLLGFLLEEKPKLVFHIEPILELYNPDDLFDNLAIKYHRKRNYLSGFLSALQKLEANKEVEILETRRLNFGSLFHEGYTLVVWKCVS